MAITYINITTGERVEKEPWCWQAVFSSGYVMNQFEVINARSGVHPIFTPFAETLKRVNDPLECLRLLNDHQPPVEVRIPQGAKPIHLYKNAIIHHEQKLESGETRTWEEKVRWYIIGYQLGKLKVGLVVTDEGRTILTDDIDGIVVTSKGAYN